MTLPTLLVDHFHPHNLSLCSILLENPQINKKSKTNFTLLLTTNLIQIKLGLILEKKTTGVNLAVESNKSLIAPKLVAKLRLD